MTTDIKQRLEVVHGAKSVDHYATVFKMKIYAQRGTCG